MDRDGTNSGYDLELTRALSDIVSVPVIASGGAGNKQHFLEAINNGAEAVLAASLFHFNILKIQDLKEFLDKRDVLVRICLKVVKNILRKLFSVLYIIFIRVFF